MFKFDFQIEEEDDQAPIIPSVQPKPSIAPSKSSKPQDTRSDSSTLNELIATLPEAISYSPLNLRVLTTSLLRRDLFDARFQLLTKDSERSEEKEDATPEGEEEEDYVDAKTDLIPGFYEGGLKTWEGGVDLVETIAESLSPVKEERDQEVGEWVRGGKVLEVGCGTALPTAFLLRSLLSLPPTETPTRTVFHLQDYNSLVLSLVTLPNLILAALPYLPPDVLRLPQEGDEPIETVVPDMELPGNLSLNEDLIAAFKSLLEERGIDVKFSHGHWEGLSKELEQQDEKYGLVLTAETIYSPESTPALIGVLREAIGKQAGNVEHKQVQLESGLGSLSVQEAWATAPLAEITRGHALVAAKVLYFGVGGDLQTFVETVEKDGAQTSTVKHWSQGVGRKVVQVGW
ncbi:hypothetical protein L202_01164 [Cryptococcus amylolentus CBS 6039]|uniref:protein-histidine N-methyltransferase n=2 Tax=Cryptococcus amylolentus TaxID=104669 RepID=A0A1E3I2S9_9TREE|nr:hypothetical protein L202_01164 [Cryptococcus amylolentus CBS 6039]ODN82914.1 hypothetical protein L202_01164 [Cryptococcus amylolentus CBS 6039]ODO10556.1 hypothetical protein I350_01153 [Cryptococcus amylolentus CBS 6273]